MALEDEQGIYRLDDIPSPPHPHCYCYLTAADIPSLEDLEKALADGEFDTPESKFSEDPEFNTRLREPSDVFKPTGKAYRDFDPSKFTGFGEDDLEEVSYFLGDYKQDAYIDLNDYLRYGELSRNPAAYGLGIEEVEEAIASMDSVMKSLGSDGVVYRSTGLDWFGRIGLDPDPEVADPDFIIGTVFKESGYTSTSLSRDFASTFNPNDPQSPRPVRDRVLFEIEVPEGIKGLYWGEDDYESEITLERGLAYTVVGAEYSEELGWIMRVVAGGL